MATAKINLPLVVLALAVFQSAGPAAEPTLSTVLSLDTPSVGASTTTDGRIFLVLARKFGQPGPELGEWKSGKIIPYPDGNWNAWKPGKDPSTAFVHVNAQRIGPEGDLWVVDVGAPGLGEKVIPRGPKLVQIDVHTNHVKRVYSLNTVTKEMSYVDDVRFSGDLAYLTDAGQPSLIVLDLKSGKARRVLEGDRSTTAQQPASGEGSVLHFPNGDPIFLHADQLEVSPDRKYLYYQAGSGPLYRIETKFLNDSTLTDAELSTHAKRFAETQATGGTAIDAGGNIYASDTNDLRILKITPSGEMSTLVADPRLSWTDALWIDGKGKLWMPAAQLNRAINHDGKPKVELPFRVYTIDLGSQPSRLDHK